MLTSYTFVHVDMLHPELEHASLSITPTVYETDHDPIPIIYVEVVLVIDCGIIDHLDVCDVHVQELWQHLSDLFHQCGWQVRGRWVRVRSAGDGRKYTVIIISVVAGCIENVGESIG